MDLALTTGRGPEVVTDFEGRRPLVRDEDVVQVGQRDATTSCRPSSTATGWDELAHLVRAAAASGRMLDMEFTIFNPTLDPTGEIATRLVACLSGALAAS